MKFVLFGVTNFKSFAGEHRVALPDRGPRKPVYLFGGLNGSGKTSLAQATVLALHGERSAGLPGLFEPGRGARDRYRKWLSAAFNQLARAAGEDQMRATAQLADGRARLTITRSWWFDAAGTFREEQLEVREDDSSGTTLLVGEDAQALIDQLLPRHLLDFAVFDGERVRNLDDTLSATAVRSALDRLLNLDAVERMRSDIERLARERRLVHANADQLGAHLKVRQQLSERSAERSRTAKLLARAEEDQDRMQRELDHLASTFDAALSAAPTSGQLSADLVSLRERRSALRSRLGRHLGEWLYLWPALGSLGPLGDDIAAQREQRNGRDRSKLELETVANLTDRLAVDRVLRRRVGAPRSASSKNGSRGW